MRQNVPEYSVSEISGSIQRTINDTYSYVKVRGEISGWKIAPSGHAYFNLKDDNAVLAAVSWRGSISNLKFKPEDGIEVVASGKVTTYPGQSKYQLVVEAIELAGQGALMALLEKRKKQLELEGLFDISRKKPIPKFPNIIGVITSPTGAVIQDIKHRIEERFPVKLLLWGVLVQGDKAASQIAAAIEGFNRLEHKPDVIIVARGGGSIEDLWPFNEEIVVRATANSKIPIISAVGHETDVTLIDFAADKRAPTPSAAAEMAVPDRKELLAKLKDLDQRLFNSIIRYIENKKSYLVNLAKAVPNPKGIVGQWQQRFDLSCMRLNRSLPSLIERKLMLLQAATSKLRSPAQNLGLYLTRLENLSKNLNLAYQNLIIKFNHRLDLNAKMLQSFDYHKTLARGFAVIRDSSGKIITSNQILTPNQEIAIELKDGTKEAIIKNGK